MKNTYIRKLCLLLGLAVPTVCAAQFTPDPTHVYKIVNRASKQVLEVGGDERYRVGHFINEWGYWGGAHQQWKFASTGNGDYFTIINRNSGQVIEITQTQGEQNEDGTFAIQNQRYANSAIQEWQFEPVKGTVSPASGQPYYKIISRNSGKVLENTPASQKGSRVGYNLYSYYPNAGNWTWQWTSSSSPDYNNSQQYDIVDVSASTAGVFRIINYNSGKALSATADDNRVTQWPMWYLAGQEWTFSEYNADGYLSIINRNTNQVLEIGGGNGGQPGATANVWDGHGDAWQQWRLVDVTSGKRLTVQDIFTTGIQCKIINRYSGLALEIGGNGGELTQDDRAANQWYDWSGPNQQWNIYIDSNYRLANSSASTPSPGGSTGTDSNHGGTVMSAGTAAFDPASSTFTLYPNPASTTLQLTLPGNGEALQVTITDAHGRTVPVSHQHGKVDVSNLASGLYIISAADGQKTFRQKFIKE
jgi:hypothetical protein